jgi:hypothetical protein
MKHKQMLKIVLVAAVLTICVGAFLNGIAKSLNQGMPVIELTAAFGRYVPIIPGTKLVFLGDVIPIGNYVFSVGDLFYFTGIFICLIAIWIALPKGRKFFPLLSVSMIGIFLSITKPDNLRPTVLTQVAAILSILGIFWQYRSGISEKAESQTQVAGPASDDEYRATSSQMGCLCREGKKQCVWWITGEFNNGSKGFCANPYIMCQTKTMCDGTLDRYVVNQEEKSEVHKLN